MPPVQFNSYAGGPHGLGPTVLPERKSILGDIGSMLNQVGQIPANMQQANLKYQLNNLLMNALTQPQTTSKEIPAQEGGQIPLPGGSMGSVFSEPTTKQVPNPEYEATRSRLEQVGPAFGMKFPTPIENIYAAALAKSLGAGELESTKQKGRLELEKEKQTGREGLQDIRGDQRIDQINRTFGEGQNRSTLQAARLKNQQLLKDKDVQARTDHDDTIREIAQDRNLNDQQKTDKILKVREKYNDGTIKARMDFNDITRKTAESAADLRAAEIDNKTMDNIVQMRSQINLLTQQATTDPSVKTQLDGAIQQYNAEVDKANANPNAPKLEYWKLEEENSIKNWLKNFTGIGTPSQQIVPTPRPGGTPPTSKPLTTTPQSGTPGYGMKMEKKTETTSKPVFRPGEVSPEELQRRRDEIFGRSKEGK